ncbi:hypothetical protein QBC34DRAFT_474597 [Podospora aff. communis PSN243]|uniref:Serine protease n=1 Tax=Podospora aff. communis PSN243 TaxID=3040156 RepID=A0AAV9G8D0_9PEZI|nr:hypothetical protein QBC34DRAFT_474597 [Podospora aff. communis PSN243]
MTTPGVNVVAVARAPKEAGEAARLASAVEPVMMATWSLRETDEKLPESAEPIFSSASPATESVFGRDDRKPVRDVDIAPGGKYRSIVKLMLRFGNRWLMGTGWLIAPDLLVTAGHCVFDHSHPLGQVQEIKAYIGYKGRASTVGGPTACQFRRGTMVATSTGWLRGANQQADMSLITVSPPFGGVKPIQYAVTPRSGTMSLGIVGYPGDKEQGEYMYEHFDEKVTFNLGDPRAGGMLTYRIDSAGGNSGSPVLRKDLVSIGVHAYGGGINKASIIGPQGNILGNYTRALTAKAEAEAGQINFVGISAPGAETESGIVGIGPDGGKTESEELTNGVSGESSSPLDRFTRAVKLAVALHDRPPTEATVEAGMPPVLGESAGTLGCLGAIALAKAGQLGQEALTGDATEYHGLVERAILQEAAFSAVMGLPRVINQQHEVFLNMSQWVGELDAGVDGASRVVRESLNAALGGIIAHHYGHTLAGRPLRPRTVEAAPGAESSQAPDLDTQKMVEGLLARSESGEMGPDQEFSLGSLANLVKNGLNVAGPLLGTAIDAGLPYLMKRLNATRTESAEEAADAQDVKPLVDAIVARAKVSEAALEAISGIPAEVAQKEGIFDDMMKAIKQVGPLVVKLAPSVIDTVTHLAGLPRFGMGAEGEWNEESKADKRKPESAEEFLKIVDEWSRG